MMKKLTLVLLALLISGCGFKRETAIEAVSNYDKGDEAELKTVWHDKYAKLMKVKTGIYYFLFVNGKEYVSEVHIKHEDDGRLDIRYETTSKKTSDAFILYKIDAQKEITGIQIYQNGGKVYSE
ncbi:MAG: hypothetical protein KH431_08415 [Erysipelotrichaceae bacterium]|nr:hypothetical protein [Erysipelotrichaceae bacterium]